MRVALERSVLGRSIRTHIYYAHPYSSWERGTNESANRIMRRFMPKGCDIGKYKVKAIRKINRYLRKVLNFKTPEELFALELAA